MSRKWKIFMTLSLHIRHFLFCPEHYAWLGSSVFQDLFGTKISWLINISPELWVLSSPCTTWYPWIHIVSYAQSQAKFWILTIDLLYRYKVSFSKTNGRMWILNSELAKVGCCESRLRRQPAFPSRGVATGHWPLATGHWPLARPLAADRFLAWTIPCHLATLR